MKKIKVNIVLHSTFSCNVYVITQGDKSILVDGSSSGREKDIVESLEKLKISLNSICIIVCTHSHFDHVGSLANMRKFLRKDVKILIHQEESKFLRKGECQYPKGTGNISKIVSFINTREMFSGNLKYEAVEPDIEMTGEIYPLDDFGFDGKKFYVLHTPGHSIGSVSLICGKFAFVGDTLFNFSIYKVFPPFADDVGTLLKSWDKLLKTKCEYYFPGHGTVISREKFAEVYRKKIKL